MRVTRVEKLEDCFDGSLVFRWHLDGAWDRARILALAPLGRLDYFPDFPRPYFRLRTAHGAQMQGVEGDSACRVILPPGETPGEIFPEYFTVAADTGC